MNENGRPGTQARSEDRPMIPAVDIVENDNEVLVTADMPGVSKDTLSIHLENDVLTLEGEIGLSHSEHFRPLLNELPGRRYARSFNLSRELDAERIQAEMRDGVLSLRIPKNDASKPRRIAVSAG